MCIVSDIVCSPIPFPEPFMGNHKWAVLEGKQLFLVQWEFLSPSPPITRLSPLPNQWIALFKYGLVAAVCNRNTVHMPCPVGIPVSLPSNYEVVTLTQPVDSSLQIWASSDCLQSKHCSHTLCPMFSFSCVGFGGVWQLVWERSFS